MSEPSIFTRIMNREIPGDFVYEDDLVFAIRDINPEAPSHILIIPRTPLPNISAFTEETEHIAGRMLIVAAKIAAQEGVDESGYRLVINQGKDAGQQVFHVHMHLLGGRKMGWPPG